MMEEQSFHPIARKKDRALGIVRPLRDVPPAHYILGTKSFSLFLNSNIGNYESGVFEAGGYKWKLSLYPKGNMKKDINGHISLYLAIAETKTLPLGWEVNVNFKLFVFDHIRDKYLVIRDPEGGIRRFHRMKTEWGFDELLPLHTFNDASNGYLFDDCCAFGAEIFVVKYYGKGESVSMLKDPVNNAYTWQISKFSAMDNEFLLTWKINNFSAIANELLFSEEVVFGEHKWKLKLFPKGYGSAKGKSLSLFLQLADCETFPSEQKLHVEFKLGMKDQVHANHFGKEAHNWFSASDDNWGFSNFLSLSDLNNASKGFLVNDAVIVEAEIKF